jgi:hypothetical protein
VAKEERRERGERGRERERGREKGQAVEAEVLSFFLPFFPSFSFHGIRAVESPEARQELNFVCARRLVVRPHILHRDPSVLTAPALPVPHTQLSLSNKHPLSCCPSPLYCSLSLPPHSLSLTHTSTYTRTPSLSLSLSLTDITHTPFSIVVPLSHYFHCSTLKWHHTPIGLKSLEGQQRSLRPMSSLSCRCRHSATCLTQIKNKQDAIRLCEFPPNQNTTATKHSVNVFIYFSTFYFSIVCTIRKDDERE